MIYICSNHGAGHLFKALSTALYDNDDYENIFLHNQNVVKALTIAPYTVMIKDDRKVLEQVSSFTFLGLVISSDANRDEEVRYRHGRCRTAEV